MSSRLRVFHVLVEVNGTSFLVARTFGMIYYPYLLIFWHPNRSAVSFCAIFYSHRFPSVTVCCRIISFCCQMLEIATSKSQKISTQLFLWRPIRSLNIFDFYCNSQTGLFCLFAAGCLVLFEVKGKEAEVRWDGVGLRNGGWHCWCAMIA